MEQQNELNRSIAQILCTIVSNDQKDWLGRCPMVEFAITSSVNATTGYAPFELNHGYMPQSGQYISTDTTFKGIKQFAQQAVWNLLDVHDFKSFLTGSQDLKVNLCGLQQDKHNDGNGKNNDVGIAGQFPRYSYTVGLYGKGPTGNYTTCTYSN